VADLLSRVGERIRLPSTRPVPAADLDPPRGFAAWAVDSMARLGNRRAHFRYLARQAVVVDRKAWRLVTTPPLIRIELEEAGSLLAVWGHPEIPRWQRELGRTAPGRRWCPPSGHRAPVLFAAGTAGVLLHELVGHAAEADLVLAGSSPLSGLLGAAVTAPTIHVVDDPGRFDLPGAFSHDDEGVPGQPSTVIRGGQLVGWLADQATAVRLGVAGGRGRRATWDQPPTARVSNLIVPPGDTAPEVLRGDLRHGLLVTRLGRATVDPVSGRLLLRVERGLEIANGRTRRPLAPFELIGGALEVLAHLDPVLGADPTPDWRLGWCLKDGAAVPTGSEAPTILAHRLEVL
jgi:predicted Zn-dependent protease